MQEARDAAAGAAAFIKPPQRIITQARLKRARGGRAAAPHHRPLFHQSVFAVIDIERGPVAGEVAIGIIGRGETESIKGFSHLSP